MFSFVTYLVYLFVSKEQYINLYYHPQITHQLESSLEELNIDPYIVEEYGIALRYKLDVEWNPLTKIYAGGVVYGVIKIDENIIPYIQWDSEKKTCCAFINILETEYLLMKTNKLFYFC